LQSSSWAHKAVVVQGSLHLPLTHALSVGHSSSERHPNGVQAILAFPPCPGMHSHTARCSIAKHWALDPHCSPWQAGMQSWLRHTCVPGQSELILHSILEHSNSGLPSNPWRQVHTGLWSLIRHSAFKPQLQGSLQTLFRQDLSAGQSESEMQPPTSLIPGVGLQPPFPLLT